MKFYEIICKYMKNVSCLVLCGYVRFAAGIFEELLSLGQLTMITVKCPFY